MSIESLINQHRAELQQRQAHAYENQRRIDELRGILSAFEAAQRAVDEERARTEAEATEAAGPPPERFPAPDIDGGEAEA